MFCSDGQVAFVHAAQGDKIEHPFSLNWEIIFTAPQGDYGYYKELFWFIFFFPVKGTRQGNYLF